MAHNEKSKPDDAGGLTRRAFMQTNLGRVVAGALTFVALNRAMACYSDDGPHSDCIEHMNTPHEDYYDGCTHTDVPAWSDQVHTDVITHSNNC